MSKQFTRDMNNAIAVDAASPRWSVVLQYTLFVVLLLLSPVAGAVNAVAPPSDAEQTLEVFTREGCPHCAAAAVFLEILRQEYPTLRILIHDVVRSPSALHRLQALARQRGIAVVGVPAFFLHGELIIGFASAETTGAQLKTLLRQQHPPRLDASPAEVCVPGANTPCPTNPEGAAQESETINVPFLGRLSARALGLPLFTVVIGLIDGFNPCAMWVLLFILSFLVNLKDRAKMVLIGGTFVLVSGVVYFAFMAAWLNLFLLVGLSRVIQLVLGAVAVFIGVVNIKDFFAFGRGISFSIPDAAKPGLYSRARRILQAENVSGAVVSVIVLAVLVNTVELLCTAGLPALYTQVLTLRQLAWWQYYAYLALYNVAYLFDDSVMLIIAVVTLSRHKLQEREGRWLKLVSGMVMASLGAVLIGKPNWLAALA